MERQQVLVRNAEQTPSMSRTGNTNNTPAQDFLKDAMKRKYRIEQEKAQFEVDNAKCATVKRKRSEIETETEGNKEEHKKKSKLEPEPEGDKTIALTHIKQIEKQRVQLAEIEVNAIKNDVIGGNKKARDVRVRNTMKENAGGKSAQQTQKNKGRINYAMVKPKVDTGITRPGKGNK